MTYNCNIERDGDMFLVDFPDLPNVLTFGNTHEHALEMAKEALDAVLEVETTKGRKLTLTPNRYEVTARGGRGHEMVKRDRLKLAALPILWTPLPEQQN